MKSSRKTALFKKKKKEEKKKEKKIYRHTNFLCRSFMNPVHE